MQNFLKIWLQKLCLWIIPIKIWRKWEKVPLYFDAGWMFKRNIGHCEESPWHKEQETLPWNGRWRSISSRMEARVWRRKSPSGHSFIVCGYLVFIWSCLLPKVPNKIIANKINIKKHTYLGYCKCSPMAHELNDSTSSVLLRGGRPFRRQGLLKGSEVLVGEPLKGVLRTWPSSLSLCFLVGTISWRRSVWQALQRNQEC